jgi:hypothetical protein
MTAFNHNLIFKGATPVKLNRIDIMRKVAVFARQILRHNQDLTLSEAMYYAWDEMKKFGSEYRLIKFTKTNGEIVSRIVTAAPAHTIIKVKGTGRPLKPGQVWFCDVARLQSGKRGAAISTYTNNIIEQF